MRNSILMTAIVVLSISNLNATNEKTMTNTENNIITVSENTITQVFDWAVQTNKGKYAGTAPSLEEAKRMIALTTSNEIIMNKQISSYFMLQNEANTTENRNYFWEVKTVSGKAKGYASTEAYARKMIALVASGDAIVDQLIMSQPQQ